MSGYLNPGGASGGGGYAASAVPPLLCRLAAGSGSKNRGSSGKTAGRLSGNCVLAPYSGTGCGVAPNTKGGGAAPGMSVLACVCVSPVKSSTSPRSWAASKSRSSRLFTLRFVSRTFSSAALFCSRCCSGVTCGWPAAVGCAAEILPPRRSLNNIGIDQGSN